MARIVEGPRVSGQVTSRETGAPLGGVTVTVNQTVYTDPELTAAVTTVVTAGDGSFSFYALPGNYTFTTSAGNANPIEPVEVLGQEEGAGTHRGLTRSTADSIYVPLPGSGAATGSVPTKQGDGSVAYAVPSGGGSGVTLAASCVADGVTDDGFAANAMLAAAPVGTVDFGRATIATKHPIIVPNGIILLGRGAMQGGSTFIARSDFCHTTVSGAQTTPAADTTTFTLTVASTAGFPLATGGITPPGAKGVLCVAGITIFYTGTTATTFTGCQVQAIDTNVTIADATDISTFLVWLCAPADAGTGFGTRLENVEVSCGTGTGVPGISAVQSSHIQEGAGIWDCNISGYRNFGIRIEEGPTGMGISGAGQWDIHDNWMRLSGSAHANAVDIDIVGTLDITKNWSGRGVRNITFVNKNLTTGPFPGLAALRLNGTTGRFADYHIENHNIGILVGDKAPCSVLIDNVNQDFNWGTGGRIELGNTAGNSADIRRMFCGSTGSIGPVLIDHVTGFTFGNGTGPAYHLLEHYVLHNDGTASINGGARIGPLTSRPTATPATTGTLWIDSEPAATIAPVQDNVAAGARDSSSSTTLTVTFTKTTTAGHHVILSAEAANAMTLTGVVDSRGNTWQVDKVSAGTGPSSSVASCHVTTAHQIGDTLTLTFSGASTFAAGIVSEWSGISATGWADVTGTNDGTTGTPTTGALTATTQPNELIFGAAGYVNATDETAGTGYTALTTQSSGAGTHKTTPVYKIVSATGTQTVSWAGTPGSWNAVGVTYKAQLTDMALSASDGSRWQSVGSLPNVGTAGTYGDATHIPQITTDAQGRVTAVSSLAVSGSGGDGWTAASNTWTRTANDTFTVAVDATGWLVPGVRIRWKESAGAFKYGVVATSAFAAGTTTVKLIGTTDYVMAATPDAGSASYAIGDAVGFPALFNYTPTITGYSANPATTAYTWQTNGRKLWVTLREVGNGTSNATTKTYSLPANVTAATLTNQVWMNFAQVTNSGTSSAAQVRISSAATVIDAFATGAGGAWTASGSARVEMAAIWCNF